MKIDNGKRKLLMKEQIVEDISDILMLRKDKKEKLIEIWSRENGEDPRALRKCLKTTITFSCLNWRALN